MYGIQQLPMQHCADDEPGPLLCTSQANRDSARRSKMRKKAENEAMVQHSYELKEQGQTLKKQVASARDQLAQLQEEQMQLKQQLADAGLVLS